MLTVVVVSYNRRVQLEHCLRALSSQTQQPDLLVVVDNASTDGTPEWLREWLPENISYAEPHFLRANYGGAGGFSEGLRIAQARGADWIWMMDDDAVPHSDALEQLLATSPVAGNIYGSLAVQGHHTAWTTTLLDPAPHVVERVSEIPTLAKVESLQFLGFMIHRDLVAKIGLPDAGFFIAADDTEYCVRARRAGAELFLAGKSRIEHPRSKSRALMVAGHRIVYLSLPPWKRYYDTRNRLLIARKYYGPRLVTQVIPSSFLRLLVALLHEPHRLAQLWAFTAGLIDGLLGIKGCRHSWWRIPQ